MERRTMNADLVKAAVLLVFLSLAVEGRTEMKVYLSADMEGVTGVVTSDHLGPAGFEYQRAREWMTREVVTAIEAARECGATEFLVSDSHGNGENIIIDELPKDVQIVRGWPRPLMMMEGIDETFDVAFLIGYHSSTSNTEGVRAHTISSGQLTDVRLNGVSVPEAGINAAIAGHFGVPIVMISGDNAIIDETKSLLGDVEGAIVKWSYSYHSARTMAPEAGYDLIRAAVKRALGRLGDFKPYRIDKPVQLEMSFKNYRPPQLLEYLPIVERIDSHSIRYKARDMIEISKFLEFVTNYSPSLEP
jgi:D-amino peptidase